MSLLRRHHAPRPRAHVDPACSDSTIANSVMAALPVAFAYEGHLT